MAVALGFIAMVSWMYTFIGAVGACGLGIRLTDLPQWWYTAAVVAVLMMVISIAHCVYGVKKKPAKDPRRLGVIRYDPETEEWYCDPGETDDQ